MTDMQFGTRGNSARMKSAPGWVLLAVLLGVLSGGCNDSMRQDEDQVSLTRAIAVVNNEKILYDPFMDEYQRFLTHWDRFILNVPGKKQEIKELLLRRKIQEKLVDQEARRKGIEVTEEEAMQQAMGLFSSQGEEQGRSEALLGRPSMAEWKRDFRRRLVHLRLVRQEVTEKMVLSSHETRKFYAKNRQMFVRPERVRVRHIAVGSRRIYNRVRQRLRSRTDFVKLVRKYSITPDRFADGDLGYVQRGILPKEFDKAIFKMWTVGAVSTGSKPTKTKMGYHIFRLEGREQKGLVSYRKALPEIRRRMIEEKQPEAYNRWLARLQERATIHIDETLLAAQ